MKNLSIREIIQPFLTKFSETDSLAPYFAIALYQAIFRSRLPTGLSKTVAQCAFERCVSLETLFRACELPSPHRWAKDPLHPRIIRLAANLNAEERRELGSLVMCYLHAQPIEGISRWWQEKADFEVLTILTKSLGDKRESEVKTSKTRQFIDRVSDKSFLLGAPPRAIEHEPMLLKASPAIPNRKSLRFQKRRFGKSEWVEVNSH